MNNTSTSSSRISPSPLHSMTSGSQVTSSPLHMTSPPLHMTSSPLHITSSPLHMAPSQLHMTSVSPFLPTMSNHIQTSPVVRGFQAPFMGTASFLSGQNVMAAPASTNPKSGSDKWTQTTLTPPSTPPATDPSLFCNVLCNMLLDRIKDTLQDAIKTYSNDADRMDKMKGIMTEALNSAGSEIDKKLSIVSVQSLIPRPEQDEASARTVTTEQPEVSKAIPLPSLPAESGPSSTHVSDYINRLSFIYGLSRPSMFNPYVKAPKQEHDGKEDAQSLTGGDKTERQPEEEPDRNISLEKELHIMEVDNANSEEPIAEDDINIVDDVDEEEEEFNELNKSIDDQIKSEGGEHSIFSSPPHASPIAPIPLNLSPTAMQEKIQASLAANGFVDPMVQYELQKLLLSAAIAQGNIPAFTPPLLSTKEGDPRSDIPVMIPSNAGFFDKREYNCQHCDATFSYGSKLRAHLICVHSIKSYQCRQCRKSFLDKEEYVRHLELHPQRKFQCDKCPSSFDKQHQLSLHYRSHTNEKPYRCQICQRQFAVNDALIRHMRIHTGERPYACNVCGKRFAQKSGLTYHSYLHTGNRPYKCTTCGQGFVHRQALKQHLMKNHLNEQVGRILNSNSSNPAGFTSAQSSSWDTDSLVTNEAMKRAFPWETKEQPSPAPFKIEGMAS